MISNLNKNLNRRKVYPCLLQCAKMDIKLPNLKMFILFSILWLYPSYLGKWPLKYFLFKNNRANGGHSFTFGYLFCYAGTEPTVSLEASALLQSCSPHYSFFLHISVQKGKKCCPCELCRQYKNLIFLLIPQVKNLKTKHSVL